MKKTILFLTLFTTAMLANYTYGGNNMGNIDMHGGKEQKLVPNQMKMNSLNGLNNFSNNKPYKPKEPVKPEVKELIEKNKEKEEKKEAKINE